MIIILLWDFSSVYYECCAISYKYQAYLVIGMNLHPWCPIRRVYFIANYILLNLFLFKLKTIIFRVVCEGGDGGEYNLKMELKLKAKPTLQDIFIFLCRQWKLILLKTITRTILLISGFISILMTCIFWATNEFVLGGTESITFLRQYIPLICFIIIYNIFGALIICLMMCLILKEWIFSCDTGDNKCWVFCIVRYLDITTRDCWANGRRRKMYKISSILQSVR